MSSNPVREHLAGHIDAVGDSSPLMASWFEAVARGDAVSDAALSQVGAGVDTTSVLGAKKVLAGVLAVLQDHPHRLRDRVPVLGGRGLVDAQFWIDLTDFVDAHLHDIVEVSQRPWVANDPATGLAMWRAVPSSVGDDFELLVTGAGAGLELVADQLDPAIAWRPAARAATDLAPIDLRDDTATRWLLALCPPDDLDRFGRTRRAIEVTRGWGIDVAQADAFDAIGAVAGERPLVVMGASILCMLDDRDRLDDVLSRRLGPTVFVSEEAVGVHRLVGHGADLDERTVSDRVVLVRSWGL